MSLRVRRTAAKGASGEAGERAMSVVEFGILGLYFLTLVILAIMGFHRYVMVWLYLKHKDKKASAAPLPAVLPRVTVQLPIYNEMYVVDRLLDAVAALRLPEGPARDPGARRLDRRDHRDRRGARSRSSARRASTSATCTGRDRTGFKAGALDDGLERATGEFVAGLRRRLRAAAGHPARRRSATSTTRRSAWCRRAGVTSTATYSLLTEVQAMHARRPLHDRAQRAQPLRAASSTSTAPPASGAEPSIADAGGWQHDTLTEDLDLRYRAQLSGWRFVYLPDVVAPAELPVEMNAFKTQQQRWAKGSVQVCKKLLPRVLASDLPWRQKVEATFHLTANLAYPLMVLLAGLMFPTMVLRYNMGWAEMIVVDVPIFLAATASVCTFYALSQKEQFPDAWKSKLRYVPAVLGIGIGLSINNALAVIEGLFGKPSEFTRTPKYGIEGASDTWKQKAYKGKSNWVPYVELALACYFTFTSIYALAYGLVGTLPFIALFQWGFLYTSGMSLAQSYEWLVPRQQEA